MHNGYLHHQTQTLQYCADLICDRIRLKIDRTGIISARVVMVSIIEVPLRTIMIFILKSPSVGGCQWRMLVN
jgi:hypothetical protein